MNVRENRANAGDLTSSKHGDSLPESKTHPSEYDEVLPSKHEPIEEILLVSKDPRILEILRVLRHHSRPKVERLRGANTA